MIPQIQVALNGWESGIDLIKITQTVVDFETVETEVISSFKGVIQPLGPEKLNIKPIELRSWKWLQIHTRTELSLETNDRIQYAGERYKVMETLDYSLNGYFEYHVIEDFETS